jgi:hypothetical protein
MFFLRPKRRFSPIQALLLPTKKVFVTKVIEINAVADSTLFLRNLIRVFQIISIQNLKKATYIAACNSFADT